jgi:hypothetical protein
MLDSTVSELSPRWPKGSQASVRGYLDGSRDQPALNAFITSIRACELAAARLRVERIAPAMQRRCRYPDRTQGPVPDRRLADDVRSRMLELHRAVRIACDRLLKEPAW